MTHVITRRSVLAIAAGLFASAASAHSTSVGGVQVGHAWALPSAANATSTAGFVPLHARGTEDRLMSVTTPRAARVEIRRMGTRGEGVVLETLRLEANRPIGMRPGALHLAFIDIDRPWVAGERVPVRLTFRDAGAVDFEFWVETAPYASQPR